MQGARNKVQGEGARCKEQGSEVRGARSKEQGVMCNVQGAGAKWAVRTGVQGA